MSEKEKKIITKKNKKRRKILYFFLTIFLLFFTFQIAFLYFSEPLLKKYIQKKVASKSNNLYSLYFDDIKINLIKRSFRLTEFHLEPDTVLYKKYLAQTNYNKAVFDLKVDTFKLEYLSVLKLLKNDRELKVEGISMADPHLKIIKPPKNLSKEDTVAKKSIPATYSTIKENVMPQIFKYFYSFGVEKMELKNGDFGFLKQGRDRTESDETFTASNISVIFNQFYIDRNNYPENELFTENIEVKIADYALNLKDGIHVLMSKDLYVSTQEKKIELSDIQLTPRDLEHVPQTDTNVYDVSIERVTLDSTNFSEIYFDKKLQLSKAKISNVDIKFYKQKKGKKIVINKDSIVQKLDLYQLIRGDMDIVGIETIELDGRFELFSNVENKKPETVVEEINLSLINFQIDSLAYLDTSKILFSDDIHLNINNFRMNLKDSIHELRAKQFVVKTMDGGGIWLFGLNLKPLASKKLWAKKTNKGLNNIKVEKIFIKNANIIKYVNKDILDVGEIEIQTPTINIKKFGESSKKRKSKPKSDIKELVKNYLSFIKVDIISLNRGQFHYNNIVENKETFTSGNINLTLYDFAFDPRRENVTKFFYANNLNLFFTNYKLKVKGNIHEINIDTLTISTFSSKIEMLGFSLQPNIKQNLPAILKSRNKSAKINFYIPRIVISENNIHKAIQNNELKISMLDVFSPKLSVTTYPNIGVKEKKEAVISFAKNKAYKQFEKNLNRNQINIPDSLKKKYPEKYEQLAKKQKVINEIDSVVANNIQNFLVKNKHVNLNDSTIEAIDSIKTLAIQNINKITGNNLTLIQIDSIGKATNSKIETIKKNSEKTTIDKDEIYANIGSFFNIIDIDTFRIHNGNLNFLQSKNQVQKEISKNKLSFKLTDFYFNYDSIEQTEKRFLFSKDIEIKLDNYKFFLKDNVHTVEAKQITLSSEKQELLLKGFNILPDTSKSDYKKLPALIYANSQNVKVTGFDFMKFYENQTLTISDFTMSDPNIKVLLQKKNAKKKDKEQKQSILLPDNLSQIKIEKLNIKSGKIKLARKLYGTNEEPVLEAKFSTKLCDFEIDSVTNFKNNPYLLPVKNIDLNVDSCKFYLKDKVHIVEIQAIKANTRNNSIQINNLEIKHIHQIKDIEQSLKQAKKATTFNIKIPQIDLANADFEKIRTDKIIEAGEIIIPKIYILVEHFEELKQNNGKKFTLDSIDIYKKISGKFNKIACDSIHILDGEAKIVIHKQKIKKINGVDNFFQRNFENISTEKAYRIANTTFFNQNTNKINSIENILPKRITIPKHLKTDTINIGVDISNTKQEFHLKRFTVDIAKFLIDKNSKIENLYSDDIVLKLFDVRYNIEKIMSDISTPKITISTKKKKIIIEDFLLKPKCKKEEYAILMGKEATYLNLSANQMVFSNIDISSLLQKKVYIGHMLIKTMELSTYKDLKNTYHDYYSQKIRFIDHLLKIPIPFTIANARIENSSIKYEQFSETSDTTIAPLAQIELTDLELTAGNLTNNLNITNQDDLDAKTWIALNQSKLMQNGNLTANLEYKLASPDDEFKMSGSLSNIDLRIFNRFVSESLGLKIYGGEIDKLEFEFSANRTGTIKKDGKKGAVTIWYKNLDAEFVGSNKDAKIVRSFYASISPLANAILIRNNSPRGRKGKINYIHDWSFGEAKYWIMALMSGVTATLTHEEIANFVFARQNEDAKKKKIKKEMEKKQQLAKKRLENKQDEKKRNVKKELEKEKIQNKQQIQK